MNPVTDPNLIAQLNAAKAAQQGAQESAGPITDPNLIAQLNAAKASQGAQAPKPQGLAEKIVQSPAAQFTLGAGQGFQEPFYQAGNIFNRMTGIPETPMPQGADPDSIAGKVGNIAGQTLAYGLGGGALNLGMKGLESAPLIGKVAQLLGKEALGPLRRTLGATGYGALMSPNDREKGGMEMGAMNAALEMLPGAAKFIAKPIAAGAAKLAAPIMPARYAESMLKGLGYGDSLEGNAKALANMVKQSAEKRSKEGMELYNPVFDKFGNTSVESKNLTKLDKKVLDNIEHDTKVNDLYQDFLEEPTLKNAHWLQSQLGTTIRKLEGQDAKGNLSVYDRKVMNNFSKLQDSLKKDIGDHLEGINPEVSRSYTNASKNWLENVVPYIENTSIAKMAKGALTNPKEVANIFRHPEPSVMKVVEDLGKEGRDRILFSNLGKYETPKGLVNAISKLDEKGLESYTDKALQGQLDQLKSKINRKSIATKTMMTLGLGSLIGLGAETHKIITGGQ
jgi:hypothetical protein